MPIIIDTDGFSKEQRESEQFKRAYREMYAQLSAPGFAHVLACHEAAHLFYLKMAGMQDYKAFPAKLYYDTKVGDYGGTLASVQPCDLTPPTSEEAANEVLWTLLKSHAAGAVVSRKLMPTLADHGEGDDKQRFMDLCEKIKRDNPSIDPDHLWEKAQTAVLRELVERPGVLTGLEKFAEEELRPKLGLVPD